jgi:hypothetical protein
MQQAGKAVMAKPFAEGDKVSWNYAGSTARGTVTKVYKERVTKTIKESEITRNASRKEPAYLIVQDDGDQVLKSQSELSRD